MQVMRQNTVSLVVGSVFLFLASFWLGVENSAAGTVLRIGGSGTDLATMKILCQALFKAHPETNCKVLPSLGSGGGVRAVQAGKLDIGLTSRPLKQSEKSPELVAIHYANTPLVFAVAESSPVHAVTQTQLKDMYSGEHIRWPSGEIARPILRPASDSDTLLLGKYFPDLKPALAAARKRRGIPTAATDQDAADMLAKVPGAFGTTTLTLIKAEKRPLKPLVLDNIAPTIENTADGTYRIFKPLYLIVNSSRSGQVRPFLDFLKSPEGKAILSQTGHVTLEF